MTTATSTATKQTQRDYLKGLNPPMAKGASGRFSAAARAELDRARDNGVVFADDPK